MTKTPVSNKPLVETKLDQARKIHVPEAGTGEIVIIPLELMSTWAALNNLKVKGWRGNYLEMVPDVQVTEVLNEK